MKFYQIISKETQQKSICYRKHDCRGPGPFAVGGNELPLERQTDYAIAMLITRWDVLFLGERRKAKVTVALKTAAAAEWVRRYPQPRQFQKDWCKLAEKRARAIVSASA